MRSKPLAGPLTFGFDIGIASVGWAVLGEARLVDLGVRAFDKAETAKEGEPLNLARRTARLLRRRLRRRAWRMTRLGRLLKREGLLGDALWFKNQPAATTSAWLLRVAALDRRLDDEEWARVVYHLCKHRGFHWTSRAEEKKAEADAKESGKVKQGLAATTRLMADKGYRSAAEMVLTEFPDAQRNKDGDYSKALSRAVLADELKLLFSRQRELGQPHAGESFESALLDRKTGLFWAQKPSLTGAALLEMLGRCTFEKGEYRAPRASFTAERHVWLTRLNNLRIVVDGSTRALEAPEREVVLPLPYASPEKFTYRHVRTALINKGLLPESFRFAGLSYPSEKQRQEESAKDPEADSLVKLPSWHELRLTLKKAGLETEWQGMAAAAIDGHPDLLDRVAWVLSVYKDDDEVAVELDKLPLPGEPGRVAAALLGLRFDRFHALSLVALSKIVPHMEAGRRYDEACAQAGYHHSQLHEVGRGEHDLLPPFYSKRDRDGRMVLRDDMDIPRNPVVLRALNQARKVMNALVRRHGAPTAVHIEMARDLSRDLDERRKIEKEQIQFRKRNEGDREEFARNFSIAGAPRGGDFEKWRLYHEQQGKCAYSLDAIDLHRLLEPGYVEVDHALPYSRSFDDSKNNKVLALVRENRNKGNRTPYEYLDGAQDSARWRMFVAFVESNKSYRLAKRSRLLRKDFGAKESEEFKERNLNDTRYICRFFKNHVERHLRLADSSTARRCVVASGQLTAFLRARWGLLKVRDESDRHHALDAAVVAACSHAMVKKLSDYSRTKELQQVREGFVDPTTGEIVNPAMFELLERHFPAPWPHFRSELEARLKIDDPMHLRRELERLGTYATEDLAALRPMFVSRAVQRRNGGAAHKDTVYGKPRPGQRLTVIDKAMKAPRVATSKEAGALAVERVGVLDRDQKGQYKFTLDSLDAIVDGQRNARMVHALRLWIEGRATRDQRLKEIDASLGRGKDKRPLSAIEAAEVENLQSLPRKPCKQDPENGPFTGPVIRSVKLNAGKTSGIPIRNGLAANASMLRVDVFKKDGKFHLVPVYVHHRVTGLPDRAIVAYKDETDWTLIDDSFAWCFALYPNDLVRVTLKAESHFGYFASCNRSTGAISLWAHDRNSLVGKDGMIQSIGAKTAVAIDKFNVDVLGNVFPATLEQRRGLA
jgi:CRISPR-associated endonuclease Csn1